MSDNTKLFEFEDHWATSVGGWLIDDEKVFIRGKELFSELKELSWMGLLLYSITGRVFDEKALKVFEALWSLGTSYPEPRLWPNRIAALAGTSRSTGVLGLGSSIAVCEAVNFGHRTNIRTVDFLHRTKAKLEAGETLDKILRAEMKQYRYTPGYGRPLRRTDERIAPLMELINAQGFGDGYFMKLAFDIEEITIKRWKMYMNVSGLDAAFSADQGLTAREHYMYMILCFTAGMFPCYMDALEKPEGCFFPLRCDRVIYEGDAARRSWDS